MQRTVQINAELTTKHVLTTT